MEPGFIKGNSSNLPKVDSLMVASFFTKNKDFCAAEFRNVKTSLSSRESYGDDAVGYVQLKRENELCTVKCRVCPEHKINKKPYTVTVFVDEQNGKIKSAQCQDCAASAGGCKHAVAFLMWLHRRSEEPSCTQIECYWKKSKLSKVGTTLKYITAAELSKTPASSTSSDEGVFNKFMEQATVKNITNCELLKYLNPTNNLLEDMSLYQLILKYRASTAEDFMNEIRPLFSTTILKEIEKLTRDQSLSNLWHELRFARLTASKAYEIMKCKTKDGALVSLIMGGKVPDTPAIKRGRLLEPRVLEKVKKTLNKKIDKCGLFICKEYPMIAASPDGIGEQFLVEIKCPLSQKTKNNYILKGKASDKCNAQMQLQMYVCAIKKCYFCVADNNFEINNKVEIITVEFDEQYVNMLLESLVSFWKTSIYPLLCKMLDE